MQECFRKYPDIYGAELADDEQPEQAEAEGKQPSAPEAPAPRDEGRPTQPHETEIQALRGDVAVGESEAPGLSRAKSAESSAPARWADATDANEQVEKPDEKAPGEEPDASKAKK